MINDYRKILIEYFAEFNIDLDINDINIVEDVDVEKAFFNIRPDQNGKDSFEWHKYNGFIVPPLNTEGLFTIIFNINRMILSKKRGDFDWVGTVVHEATHIDDYIKYRKILSVKSYDELFDYRKYGMFNCWTEFHARLMGHYYVYKYRKSNKCETAEEKNIKSEMEKLIEWFNRQQAETDDGYMWLYLLMQFMGMISALRLHYPSIITETLIKELFAEHCGLDELYRFLNIHNAIEKVSLKFDTMYSICKKIYPHMP